MEGQLSSYFRRLGPDRLQPTALTSGAWTETEQHVSPTVGLCVHELERRAPSDLQVARVGVEVLGTTTLDPVEVEVVLVRPGRTIELSEVVVSQAGRAVVRARVWRLAAYPSAVPGEAGPAQRLPDPGTVAPWAMSQRWPGGFIGSLDVRAVAGPEPGRATCWVSTGTALVADEPSSDLAALMGLVDTANGIAVLRSPQEWLYPNVDLTVHLHRRPTGRWLGLDTTVTLGDTGLGLTESVLHDTAGPVGRAAQVLTVRSR